MPNNPLETGAFFQRLGRYAGMVKAGQVFSATAILTAPVIFTTAAGTGGPLLWNSSTDKDAHLLAVGFSSSVVTTVAGGLGITGGVGQAAAPSSTTAIDFGGNLLLGGAATGMNVYRVGTVTNAGALWLPFAQFHTGALTVSSTATSWVELGGLVIVPPGGWASPAGSATLSTLQVRVTLIWAEIPK